ncbi:MAG: CPBP family intramembrane metalloprotease [Candidatus Eisenbacteria bacterium]|nr:CPBP family intramembrane metalloprotease [Candidatus Eisenbacteria bacterium]
MFDALTFIPVLALAFLASLGERWRPAAGMTYLLLGLIDLLMLIAGAAVVAAGLNPWEISSIAPELQGPSQAILASGVGWALLATGLLGAVLLVPAVRRGVTRPIPLAPEGPLAVTVLHLVAVILGLSAAQLILMPYIWEMAPEALVTPAGLVVQAVSFLLLALLGVGFPLRRNLAGVRRRLNLVAPSVRQILVAVGLTALGVAGTAVIESLWIRYDPQGALLFEERLGNLFRAFESPVGIAIVGLAAGIGEEILFRGALQPRLGLIPTAVVFTLIHSYYGLTPAWLWIAIIGFGLGVLRAKTNTTTCILFHALYNSTSFFLGS